jgi:hypothetical protein
MEKPEDSKKDSDAEMTVALFQAAKSEDFELVKKLISDGADPLATKLGGDPNLLLILYRRLKCTLNNDKVLQIIKYILNLPEYQELSEKSEAIYHKILLRMASDLPYHFELVSPMLQLMFKLKTINYLIFEETTEQSFLLPQVVKMNPTALFIFYLVQDINETLDDQKYKILYRLLEIGFSMQESHDCVTPLTILLLKCKINYWHHEIEGQKLMKLVNKFIENGVNIESSVLSVQSVLGEHFLDIMKTQLMVPDVLYLSIAKHAMQLVFVFLPHWWGPPLALLLFNLFSSYGSVVCHYFHGLSEYGGVPHGTIMFARLNKLMEKVRRRFRDDPHDADYDAVLRYYYPSFKNLVGKNKIIYIAII